MARSQRNAPEENTEEQEGQVDAQTEEQGTEDAPKDSRAAALSALASQNEAPTVEKPKSPERVFEGGEVEAGGTVRVGVLFDKYLVPVEKRVVSAVAGQVMKVSAEVADRGEALGGLVRL